MSSTTWDVTAEPVGRFWHISVAGLEGATQAKKSSEIDAMVRDFISEMTGEKSSRIKINLSVRLPKDVSRALLEAQKLREEADQARKEASFKVGLAARLLKDDGYTVRDIGLALGVSFQRAQQLLKQDAK